MSRWRFQRGEISPGCIVGVIILLLAAFVGIRTVPTISRIYEFRDEAVSIADKANTSSWKDPKRMQEALVRKAEELRLPVAPEAIKITRNDKNVEIKISYDIEIDYSFYTHKWHEEIDEFRPLF
jgi:hypothetical protein